MQQAAHGGPLSRKRKLEKFRYVGRNALARAIFALLLTGKSEAEVVRATGLTEEEVREILQWKIKRLLLAEAKLAKATRRCAELVRKIHAWGITGPYADDQPLEALRPPGAALKKFHEAGVYTLAELRTVTVDDLLRVPGFRAMYIEWAIAQLDERCLTHNLHAPSHNRIVKWRRRRRSAEEAVVLTSLLTGGRPTSVRSSESEETGA